MSTDVHANHPGAGPIFLLDHLQQPRPLRRFWFDQGRQILFFHDGLRTFPALMEAGVFGADTIVVQSSSWYRTPESLKGSANLLRRCMQIAPPGFTIERNLLLLANSREEYEAITASLPGVPVLLFNNTAFLNEQEFTPGTGPKRHDAVLNAKPAPFKRHHLAAGVPNRVVISYGAEGIRASDGVDAVDLAALHPGPVVWNASPSEVQEVLRASRVGLALSAEEGACYASTEYLLCGLPVASTASRGGRAEFYTTDTALIVEPDPAAVTAGVATLIARLAAGEIRPEAIRAQTVQRLQAFRRSLADALDARLAALGFDAPAMGPFLHARIAESSKLSAFRNFWISGVAPRQP